MFPAPNTADVSEYRRHAIVGKFAIHIAIDGSYLTQGVGNKSDFGILLVVLSQPPFRNHALLAMISSPLLRLYVSRLTREGHIPRHLSRYHNPCKMTDMLRTLIS